MDGNELARQLKRSRPDLPVLMVTGEHANNFPPDLTSYVADNPPQATSSSITGGARQGTARNLGPALLAKEDLPD